MTRAWLLAVAVLALAPAAAGAGGCVRFAVEDEAGDVAIASGVPYSGDTVDLRRLQLDATDAELRFALDLGASPVGRDHEYVRYWIVVEVDGQRASLRIAHTRDYDAATLVGPNEMENPSWGRFPVAWNASRLEIVVPRAAIEEAWGRPADVTQVAAQSDGIHRSLGLQGPAGAAPYVQDFLGEFEDAQATSCAAAGAAPAARTPAGGLVALLATVGAVAACARRR